MQEVLSAADCAALTLSAQSKMSDFTKTVWSTSSLVFFLPLIYQLMATFHSILQLNRAFYGFGNYEWINESENFVCFKRCTIIQKTFTIVLSINIGHRELCVTSKNALNKQVKKRVRTKLKYRRNLLKKKWKLKSRNKFVCSCSFNLSVKTCKNDLNILFWAHFVSQLAGSYLWWVWCCCCCWEGSTVLTTTDRLLLVSALAENLDFQHFCGFCQNINHHPKSRMCNSDKTVQTLQKNILRII